MSNKKKQIKVYFIIPSIGVGGAERFATNFMHYYDKNEVDATLIILKKSDPEKSFDISGVEHYEQYNFKNIRDSIIFLIKKIKKEQPDIVLSTVNHLNLFMGVISFLIGKKKTKFVLRQSNLLTSFIAQRQYSLLYKTMFN